MNVATILSILFPIFGILGIGFGLTKAGLLAREVQKGLNWLAFYVGLPALLFHKVGVAELGGETAAPLLWTLLIATGINTILGLIVSRAMRLPGPSLGALTQAAFRGNLAFVALPVILYATNHDERIETLVIFTIVPGIIVYNLLSVTLLVLSGPRSEAHPFKDTLVKLGRNPLLIGCFAGLAWNVLDLPMPMSIGRLCDSLGKMAFPMALIGIGSQIARTAIRGPALNGALASTVLKSIVAPIIAYLVAVHGFGLSGQELLAAVCLLATPTAVSAYVMADLMHSDSELAATAIATSAVCSVASFGLVLWFLG